MQSIALVIHVILAVVVIGLVLMQHGKGADAGAAFGSGASATVFGARGASSFLTRMTTVAATLFFLTSVLLFWLAAHRESGVRSVTDAPGLVDDAPAPVAVPGDAALDETSDLPGDLPGGVPATGEALPVPDAAGRRRRGTDRCDRPVAPASDDAAVGAGRRRALRGAGTGRGGGAARRSRDERRSERLSGSRFQLSLPDRAADAVRSSVPSWWNW